MPCLPVSPSQELEPESATSPSRCEVPRPARAHHPECACVTCSHVQTGLIAYRQLAEALGSDDPAILDPPWRRLCQQRIDAFNQHDPHRPCANPSQSAPATHD